jgi:hypothetical protein
MGIGKDQLKLVFQNSGDRAPEHASPNVAKNVLDWEYTTEILRSDLHTRLRDQLQASPPRSVLFHEGSCSQGPGALHVQRIPSEEAASGGQHHV